MFLLSVNFVSVLDQGLGKRSWSGRQQVAFRWLKKHTFPGSSFVSQIQTSCFPFFEKGERVLHKEAWRPLVKLHFIPWTFSSPPVPLVPSSWWCPFCYIFYFKATFLTFLFKVKGPFYFNFKHHSQLLTSKIYSKCLSSED